MRSLPRKCCELTARLLCLIAIVQIDFANASEHTQDVDFDNDVLPVLTKFGCNSGPCHGKARGQGGFKLSLLGFDSDSDYESIVHDGRGRRVFHAAAENSLLITKPTGIVAHGGGRRFDQGSDEYRTLINWIHQGAQRSVPRCTRPGFDFHFTQRDRLHSGTVNTIDCDRNVFGWIDSRRIRSDYISIKRVTNFCSN